MLCPARTYRSVLECGYIKVNQNDPRVRPFYAPVISTNLLLTSPSSAVARLTDINSAVSRQTVISGDDYGRHGSLQI